MAILHNLSEQNSIFNHFLGELRNVEIQTDRMRFRRNLERIGEILAYEVSKSMNYVPVEITTPLGIAQTNHINEQPVMATILRAGLPLHQGLLNYFDQADNAFISAYRRHHKDNSFDVQVEYLSSPSLENRVLIISDPMLATGTSMLLSYKGLLERGKPSAIHIVSVIASPDGIALLEKHLPDHTHIWVGGIDDELTVQSYIVPGLGDAGDLAFGEKI